MSLHTEPTEKSLSGYTLINGHMILLKNVFVISLIIDAWLPREAERTGAHVALQLLMTLSF